MNMLDKLDRLEHDDMGCGAGYGSVCTCGLDEVRAAVRTLVDINYRIVKATWHEDRVATRDEIEAWLITLGCFVPIVDLWPPDAQD